MTANERVEQVLAELRQILTGIDQDDADGGGGWWPTSTGAEFGAQKLAEVEALIRRAFDPDS